METRSVEPIRGGAGLKAYPFSPLHPAAAHYHTSSLPPSLADSDTGLLVNCMVDYMLASLVAKLQ